jgi:hypothetical protein
MGMRSIQSVGNCVQRLQCQEIGICFGYQWCFCLVVLLNPACQLLYFPPLSRVCAEMRAWSILTIFASYRKKRPAQLVPAPSSCPPYAPLHSPLQTQSLSPRRSSPHLARWHVWGRAVCPGLAFVC